MTPKYIIRPSTDELVIHCSDTTAGQDVDAATIRKWHVEENGWIDIGYHFVIRRSGELERGRPLKVIGAHVAGFNRSSVGICLVGGKSLRNTAEDNFTPPQWTSLKWLVRLLRDDVYENQIEWITGHRDHPGVTKLCPAFDVTTWLNRERV